MSLRFLSQVAPPAESTEGRDIYTSTTHDLSPWADRYLSDETRVLRYSLSYVCRPERWPSWAQLKPPAQFRRSSQTLTVFLLLKPPGAETRKQGQLPPPPFRMPPFSSCVGLDLEQAEGVVAA